MKEIVMKTKNLSKHYGNFAALDSVSMEIYKGDIYGLIGRNGAGKTTLMKVVTGLTEKTDGEFELFSKSNSEAVKQKRRIGCLIENPAFFGNLTAYQNLKYYAIQKGITDMNQIDNALEVVGLMEGRNKKFRKFSLGMKQRLGIAFAIMDNPDFIILDEPINGLDPIGISEMRDTFKRLNQDKGVTIIISSHILSEMYMVANRFLFIEKGQVLKELTKEELDIECMRCIAVKTDNIKKMINVLERELGIDNYKMTDNEEVRIYEDNIDIAEVNRVLNRNNINILGIYETGISLEDYFKSLIDKTV